MISGEILRGFELFDGLEDRELTAVAELCRERTLEKGVVCFAQGRKAKDLYLCRSGKVKLVAQHFEAPNIRINTHTAIQGEAFGWSALVEPCRYTSSAECAERTEVIYTRGADLLKLFNENPRTGYVVMRNLTTIVSARLMEIREKISRELAMDIRDDYEW